jgi:hypothetical protein
VHVARARRRTINVNAEKECRKSDALVHALATMVEIAPETFLSTSGQF